MPEGIRPVLGFLLACLLATPLLAGEPAVDCVNLTWDAGPDMAVARSIFPWVALPTGGWLAAGGFGDPGGFLLNAEILDSSATVWASAELMPSSHRGFYHGILLDDGDVLISGEDPHIGSHPHPSTAYLYDESLDQWNATVNTPSRDRFSATMTLLPDGKVLFAGGYDNHSDGTTYATADLYDPVTGVWSATGTMAEVRTGHTATLLTQGPNAGKVLVVGGSERSPVNAATTGCELYDPATGMWSATGSLNESRSVHTATLLPSGYVLVTGGQYVVGGQNRDSAELYDPVTGTWSLVAPMSTPRGWHRAILLLSQEVLVAGGRTGGGGSTALQTVEIYDPKADTWTPVACLSTERYNHGMILLNDGRVAVAGGSNAGSSVLASTELYTPDGIFADGFESGDISRWSLGSP